MATSPAPQARDIGGVEPGENNRIQILRLLDGAGKAVTAAGNKAINDGSAKALHEFLITGYPVALAEDDRVTIPATLAQGGPWYKAAGQAALDGPAWMCRAFLERVDPKAATLDADTNAHTLAVRTLINQAAKVASQAQKEACQAQEAAAEARQAAAEAKQWADKATNAAAKAADYAKAALQSANQAEASADAAYKSAAPRGRRRVQARSAASHGAAGQPQSELLREPGDGIRGVRHPCRMERETGGLKGVRGCDRRRQRRGGRPGSGP